MRDDFPRAVQKVVAARVAHRCSNPECRAATSGPTLDPDKFVNVGQAAHICAAAPGGPRYDANMTPEQRRDGDNCLWLCVRCATIVDRDKNRYPIETLRRWRRDAETEAATLIGHAVRGAAKPTAEPGGATETLSMGEGGWLADERLSTEELDILVASAKLGEIYRLSTSQAGDFVRAGANGGPPAVDYFDPADRLVAESHLEALGELTRRGLARHVAGVQYQLTGSGLQLARELTPRAAESSTTGRSGISHTDRAAADQLGDLRREGWKRHLQWLSQEPDAEERAEKWRVQTLEILERHYGKAVSSRFNTPTTAEALETGGWLVPGNEHSHRVDRLGEIIEDILSGRLVSRPDA